MRGLLRALVLGIAAVLCAATSAPRYPRNFPMWVVTDPAAATKQLGCAQAHVWVSKSGKTGFGVSYELQSTAPDCTLALTRARLVVGAVVVDTVPANAGPVSAVPTNGYLPFEFDNNTAWNRGERTGVLTLTFSDGTEWTVPLLHRWDRPHHDRYGGRR